jgi:hypothetical protein
MAKWVVRGWDACTSHSRCAAVALLSSKQLHHNFARSCMLNLVRHLYDHVCSVLLLLSAAGLGGIRGACTLGGVWRMYTSAAVFAASLVCSYEAESSRRVTDFVCPSEGFQHC